jgi:hypothetical protein
MWELDLLLNAPAVANGTLDQQAPVPFLSFRQLQGVHRCPREGEELPNSFLELGRAPESDVRVA